MMKILVLTYFISTDEVRYYFFDSHIVKEYVFNSEEIQISFDKEFELYEIQTGIKYKTPFTRDRRIIIPKTIASGGWKVKGKTITKTETSKVKCSDFDCLKVTEYSITDTPFGSGDFFTSKYYANLDHLIEKYKEPGILSFLGGSDSTYAPYLFPVRIETGGMDNITILIFHAEINYQEIDITFLENILQLPIVSSDD